MPRRMDASSVRLVVAARTDEASILLSVAARLGVARSTRESAFIGLNAAHRDNPTGGGSCKDIAGKMSQMLDAVHSDECRHRREQPATTRIPSGENHRQANGGRRVSRRKTLVVAVHVSLNPTDERLPNRAIHEIGGARTSPLYEHLDDVRQHPAAQCRCDPPTDAPPHGGVEQDHRSQNHRRAEKVAEWLGPVEQFHNQTGATNLLEEPGDGDVDEQRTGGRDGKQRGDAKRPQPIGGWLRNSIVRERHRGARPSRRVRRHPKARRDRSGEPVFREVLNAQLTVMSATAHDDV